MAELLTRRLALSLEALAAAAPKDVLAAPDNSTFHYPINRDSSRYVLVPKSEGFDPEFGKGFTVEAWLKPRGYDSKSGKAPRGGFIISKGLETIGKSGFGLHELNYMNEAGKLQRSYAFLVPGKDVRWGLVTPSVSHLNGGSVLSEEESERDVHVAGVLDAQGDLRMYINGRLVHHNPYGIEATPSEGHITIGSRQYGDGTYEIPYDGRIQTVRVTKAALEPGAFLIDGANVVSPTSTLLVAQQHSFGSRGKVFPGLSDNRFGR